VCQDCRGGKIAQATVVPRANDTCRCTRPTPHSTDDSIKPSDATRLPLVLLLLPTFAWSLPCTPLHREDNRSSEVLIVRAFAVAIAIVPVPSYSIGGQRRKTRHISFQE